MLTLSSTVLNISKYLMLLMLPPQYFFCKGFGYPFIKSTKIIFPVRLEVSVVSNLPISVPSVCTVCLIKRKTFIA